MDEIIKLLNQCDILIRQELGKPDLKPFTIQYLLFTQQSIDQAIAAMYDAVGLNKPLQEA